VEVIALSTPEAIKHINDPDTNLILHLTCWRRALIWKSATSCRRDDAHGSRQMRIVDMIRGKHEISAGIIKRNNW